MTIMNTRMMGTIGSSPLDSPTKAVASFCRSLSSLPLPNSKSLTVLPPPPCEPAPKPPAEACLPFPDSKSSCSPTLGLLHDEKPSSLPGKSRPSLTTFLIHLSSSLREGNLAFFTGCLSGTPSPSTSTHCTMRCKSGKKNESQGPPSVLE